MVINEDAATLKLLRDYQENGQRIGGLTNVVHSKVTAIRKLLDLMESADPDQVVAVDDGFKVPPRWTARNTVAPWGEIVTLVRPFSCIQCLPFRMA